MYKYKNNRMKYYLFYDEIWLDQKFSKKKK